MASVVGLGTQESSNKLLSSMAATDVLLMALYIAVLTAAHKSAYLQRLFRPSHQQKEPAIPGKVS